MGICAPKAKYGIVPGSHLNKEAPLEGKDWLKLWIIKLHYMHNRYLEVLIEHAVIRFRPIHSNYFDNFSCAYNIAATGTIFNVFSYDAV